MIEINPKVVMEQLEKGLGDQGDLTLMIACTKCDATFELGFEGVAMTVATNQPFIEYLRWVQNSKCPTCNPLEKFIEKPDQI